jgi:hypothetical protein
MTPDTDITVTITRPEALALCTLAGLLVDDRGRYGGKYWQLDEATRVAVERIAAGEQR